MTSGCSWQLNLVPKLEVKDESINQVISKLFNEQKKEYDWDKSVFVVRVKKSSNLYEIRVSVLYRDDFNYYLNNKKDRLIGFFEYGKNPVLVFGDSSNLFLETDEAKSFEFLDNKNGKNEKKGEPPIILEPEVRIYNYNDGKMVFKEKGLFNLLE